MTVTIYPNGTGGTLGDELVTETELYTTGYVYFVHHTGDDANSGFIRQKPWASLVHALTVAVDCDTLVLLDGHTETILAPQSVTQDGLKIVGEGSDEGVPTVELTSGLSDQSMLTISGTNVALGNIRFKGGSIQANTARVAITGPRSMVRGCYFECDELITGTGSALSWSIFAAGPRLFSTKFVVTSTTTPPQYGLLSQGMINAEMEACTFDGGTVGFFVGGYVDFSVFLGTSPANLRCQQIRLLNGAGFVTGSETTGYLGIAEKTGASVVSGFGNRLASGFRQLGDAMLADTEFYYTGDILYVHYGTGDDANSGVDELAPKKTTASALSVLSEDCSLVVLLPSHVEPVTNPIAATPLDGTTIVGCGTSDGKPSCRIYNSDAAAHVLVMDLSGAIRNIWFDKTTSEDPTTSLVDMLANYNEMRGCLVTPGPSEIGCSASSSLQTFRESKFESSGTAVATRPSRGLSFSSEGTMTDEDVRGCVFSNSQYGFSQKAFQEDESVTRLYVISMTQSFGADVNINDTTTGIVNPETSSGSASVEWG